MKTDVYTKFMLTIIAACLLALTLRGRQLLPSVQAGPVAGKNMSYGVVPLNEDGSITVRLSDHDQINVNIADITTSDELDINIDEIGGGYVSNGGPINVKVSN